MDKKKNTWLTVSIVATICAIVGYLVASSFTSSSLVDVRVSRSYAGIATLVAIVAFVVDCIAFFKTTKRPRILLAINILLSLIIAFLAYFAYWFSGYAL